MECSAGGIANAEVFDPATGLFTAVGNMNVARYNHTATVLPNGHVLTAGGQFTASNEIASAEMYDPVAKTFTLTNSLNVAKAGQTATTLEDRRILFAGGQTVGGNFVAAGEIYDPVTGDFTLTGNMNTVREFQTATLLKGGKVLLVGGVTNATFASSSVEFEDGQAAGRQSAEKPQSSKAGGLFETVGSARSARNLRRREPDRGWERWWSRMDGYGLMIRLFRVSREMVCDALLGAGGRARRRTTIRKLLRKCCSGALTGAGYWDQRYCCETWGRSQPGPAFAVSVCASRYLGGSSHG